MLPRQMYVANLSSPTRIESPETRLVFDTVVAGLVASAAAELEGIQHQCKDLLEVVHLFV